MQATTTRPALRVTTDGRGVASRVGTRLLADLADAAGLSAALAEALTGLRQRRSLYDPGRVLTDLAVMLADGGEAISDLAVLRDQPTLFGSVASTATAWRVLDAVDTTTLHALQAARARARERAWLLRAEGGRPLPASRAGSGRRRAGARRGRHPGRGALGEGGRRRAFQGRIWIPHPLLVWLDNTGEALAGLLRPGNAGANTAADHIT